MSAQGPLPSASAATGRSPRLTASPLRRSSAGPLAGAAAAIALTLAPGCGALPADYVVTSKTAPDTHHVALVRLVRCDSSWCESLAIGSTPDAAAVVATLAPKDHCTQAVWSADGKRAGFVVNGQQLRLYEADSHRPAGQFDLVPRDSDPPTREARGVTFSENGASLTYDDCPRERSGCRAAIIALR